MSLIREISFTHFLSRPGLCAAHGRQCLAHVQTTSFPNERFGDPGIKYLCVVSTGFVEIIDHYIYVTELQIHCSLPVELTSMPSPTRSEFDAFHEAICAPIRR